MKIFITGASGHNGGALAAALLAAGHWVSGLARSLDTAAALDKLGIAPLRGTLDDAEVLAEATRAADVMVNAACLHPRRGLSADVGGLFSWSQNPSRLIWHGLSLNKPFGLFSSYCVVCGKPRV